MSYTEKEYRYALEKGKPVIGFLHGNPASIASGKTEKDEGGKRRLSEFRALVEKKLCKKWTNPEDLAGAVGTSLQRLMKTRDAVGWVRGDTVDDKTGKEVLELREKVRLLTEQLESRREPDVLEGLARGDEEVELVCVWTEHLKMGMDPDAVYEGKVKVTWDWIVRVVLRRLFSSARKMAELGVSLGQAVVDGNLVKPRKGWI